MNLTLPIVPAGPTQTQCGHCFKMLPLVDALVVVRSRGHDKDLEHYCSEHCANEDMFETLRVGL